MKIIKLQGGLGNQMFQYAFARGLAEKTKEEVYFDFSGFDAVEGVTPRSFSLDAFNVVVQKASTVDIQSLTKGKRSPRLIKIQRMLCLTVPAYVHEKEHSFHPELWEIHGNAYFDGYWQSEKYFLHVAKEIREAFVPRQPLGTDAAMIAKKITDTSISLHVRRGDYVTNKKASDALGACDLGYYQKAITKALTGLEIPHIFVFSDDIAWVKKNITIPYEATFVSEYNLNDWEELVLMSLCRRHIISNSSFSWWGAWLDARHGTMVIAPLQWVKDSTLTNKDITPPSWIRL